MDAFYLYGPGNRPLIYICGQSIAIFRFPAALSSCRISFLLITEIDRPFFMANVSCKLLPSIQEKGNISKTVMLNVSTLFGSHDQISDAYFS